jgi:hypothetical protein
MNANLRMESGGVCFSAGNSPFGVFGPTIEFIRGDSREFAGH